MSAEHDRQETGHSNVPSLPPVCEIFINVPSNAHNEVEIAESASNLDSDPLLSSDSEHATLKANDAAQPPQCDRIHSPPSFRLARSSAIDAMTPRSVSSRVSVQKIHEAIVKDAPHALVAHVHHCETSAASNLISIASPHDFDKGFTDGVPSFILVDGCEQSATLAVEMLMSQAGRTNGAVIVLLVEQLASVDFGLLVEKVPDLMASGADDVIMIPRGATNLRLSTSVSLARAQSNREQRIKLKRQIQASKTQCDRLFWEIVHEQCPGFPEVQPQLHEIRHKRVANLVLGRKLGDGTYASVYLWEDSVRHRHGAVKVFPKESISSAKCIMQMATEFAVSQRLNHPNVVHVYKAVHGIQSVYLLMEMAGTKNLFQIIKAADGAGGLPRLLVEGFSSQIAAGVAYCHKMRVAHCDLKPENIVISDSGCAKIVDFGQAVDLVQDVAPLKSPIGTIPFMAPEIMLFCADWKPSAADIWSLAVIVVEMLCGNHAFVRLLGWGCNDQMDATKFAQYAEDLKTSFANDERNAHAPGLVAISGLCHGTSRPSLIHLLGDMLEITPEKRIAAVGVVERIQEILAWPHAL